MSSHPPEHVRGPLGPLIVSGLAWKGTSQVLMQLTRLGVALALARILAPENYGVAAMVLVFAGFSLIFSDLALGQALVQRRMLTQLDCSTAFWTTVLAGVAFMLTTIALAGPAAAFFGEPALKPMVTALSASFIVAGAGTTQSALLVRAMRFRSLELREVAATALGAGVAMSVALAGGGAWAVVAQQLAVSAASTVLVWRFSTWRPDLSYSLSSLRGLAGFSANVFGENVLRQARPTIQSVLIGRVLGAPALGAYTLAYNVVLVPFNRVAVPLSQVLFPALSSVQDDRERMRSYWLRGLRMLTAIALPAGLGLLVVAPDFVHVVLGEEWQRSVPVIQLLALVGVLQTFQVLNPAILQALDRTSLLFVWSLASFAVTLVSLAIGLRWGITGVAVALVTASILTEPAYVWLTARAVGVGVGTLLRAVSGVTQASVVMAGVLLGAKVALVHQGAPPGVRLVVLVGVGVASYLVATTWRAPAVVADLRAVRRRSSEPAGGPVTTPQAP